MKLTCRGAFCGSRSALWLLREMGDRFAEMDRLADLSTDILYETGEFIYAMSYRPASYNDPRLPLMYAIRTEGSDL